MNSQGSTKNQSDPLSPKILSEQTRFSFDVFPLTTSMLIIVIALIAFLVWENIDKNQAGYWFAAALIVVVIRVAIYITYKKSDQQRDSIGWRYAFLTGTYASALLTCFAIIFFYPKLPEAEKMVFSVLILGIVSGILPLLSTNLKSYAIYLLLNVLPLALMNLATPILSFKLVGAIMLLFIGMLMIAAYLFNRALLDSLIYRYRSEQLASRLQAANNQLSAANRELQKISIIDELTGTYNRRFFNQRFKEVWTDHLRQNQSLSALMIDIDYFKDYNDIFGHLQGDLCLKRIAAEINGVIHRPRDFVARFGGEEFIMLLPNTDISGVKGISELIHERVKQLAMPHKIKGCVSRVTISIGGASIQPTNDYLSEKFLHQVDKALYQAKNQGRNKTVLL